ALPGAWRSARLTRAVGFAREHPEHEGARSQSRPRPAGTRGSPSHRHRHLTPSPPLPPVAPGSRPGAGRSQLRGGVIRLTSCMDALFNDLRYTLRTLIKAPAFTLAAVAALTLGIGANTAIFSVLDAVLLRPLAAPDPQRVVFFMNTTPQGSGP